jgi:hypothetical protein
MRKKAAFFGVFMVPITTLSAGMTIFIDNAGLDMQKPLVANDVIINLDENIIVNFAEPIHDVQMYEENVEIYPRTQVRFFWGNNGSRLTIVPQSVWKSETEYSLIFPHNTYDQKSELSTFFTFETVAYPSVIHSNSEGTPHISEDGEIVMAFDRAIDRFDVHAVVRPFLQTEQYYDPNERKLHIKITERSRARDGFHTLTLFAKHVREDDTRFFPITSLSFTATVPEPDNWPEQFDVRMELAKRATAPKITDGKYIDVNLDAQVTTLFEDGDFIANFVASSGAENTPTPKGSFEIYNKHPYALSNMFQVYLPYWMAFSEDGKYGFHDLIVWPEGHEDMPSGGKESIQSIGNAVSPGCVRHDAENSKFIYEWADVGTKVVIY